MGGTKAERNQFITEDLPPDASGKLRFEVLVTSYEGLLKEKGKLGKIDWKYLIIGTYQALESLKARSLLSLTSIAQTKPSESRMKTHRCRKLFAR